MAKNTNQVFGFLRDRAAKLKPQAEQERSTLKAFAKQDLGIDNLQFWDIAYTSEKLKIKVLSLSQEILRPYFPVKYCLEGLFNITKQLFNIRVQAKQGVSTWYDDVQFLELYNEHNEVIGQFYLDLYARKNKRSGAWMDSAVTRWKDTQGHLQKPVAYLICNFTPTIAGKEACLTHNELTTLFHEFGHGIIT